MQNMPCCQLCFYRPSQSGPRQESAAIHIAWPLTWHKSFSFSLSFPPFAWFLPSFLSFQESGWRASSHSSFPFSDPLLRCCQGSSPGGGVPGRQVCVVIYLIRPNVTRCCFLCVCVCVCDIDHSFVCTVGLRQQIYCEKLLQKVWMPVMTFAKTLYL